MEMQIPWDLEEILFSHRKVISLWPPGCDSHWRPNRLKEMEKQLLIKSVVEKTDKNDHEFPTKITKQMRKTKENFQPPNLIIWSWSACPRLILFLFPAF